MNLLRPDQLAWAICAVAIGCLYWWRGRRHEHPVAALWLWQRALARRTAWSRWRGRVALLLQMSVVLLLALALTEPYWGERSDGRTTVLVVDTSASTGATDVESLSENRLGEGDSPILLRGLRKIGTVPGGSRIGSKPSRLASVLDAAKGVIDGLEGNEQATIITCSSATQVKCGLTGDREKLREALGLIAPTNGPNGIEMGVRLARKILVGKPNPRIFIFTDGAAEVSAQLRSAGIQWVVAAGNGRNVGITQLEARPSASDPQVYDVLVEVANFGPERIDCRMSLASGDRLDVPQSLASGESFRHVYPVRAERPTRISARLDVQDDLAADNEAQVTVGPRGPRRVVLVTDGNAALEAALRSVPDVELEAVQRAGKNNVAAITVLDRKVPERLPSGPIVAIAPNGGCDLWNFDEEAAGAWLVRQSAETPLLAHVDLGSVTFEDIVRLKFKSPATTLVATTGGDPLCSLIDREAGPVLVLHASLAKSDLALRPEFPLLLANAIGLVDCGDETAEPRLSTSDRMPASNLLDRRESDLRSTASGLAAAELPKAASFAVPLWILLVAAAFGLAVLDWGLARRRVEIEHV